MQKERDSMLEKLAELRNLKQLALQRRASAAAAH